MAKKFDYRIVTRNTLGDLEKQVRFLQRDRWQLQYSGSPSIAEALDMIAQKKSVAVSMKREK
jgi:hypothetical protein